MTDFTAFLFSCQNLSAPPFAPVIPSVLAAAFCPVIPTLVSPTRINRTFRVLDICTGGLSNGLSKKCLHISIKESSI